jgi:hypothetical protein
MAKPHPEEALIRRVWAETAVHQWNARKAPGPLQIDVPSAMKAPAPPGKPTPLPRSLIFEETTFDAKGQGGQGDRLRGRRRREELERGADPSPRPHSSKGSVV